MGLYESIEKILTNNNGEVSEEIIIESLVEEYAKETITKFLSDNANVFIRNANRVILKDYKINNFIKILADFLKDEKIYDYEQIKYLAEIFLQNSKHGYKKPSQIDGFFGISKNEHIKRISQDIFSLITKEDWKNKLFVYKLSVRFFSLLLDQLLHGKMLYSTPDSLVDLILRFIPKKENLNVYNPASGLLKLLTAISVFSDAKINAYASEINSEIFELGTFLALSNKFHSHFENRDSLDDWHWKSNKYDLAVCNPPFNVKIKKFLRHEYPYSDLSLNLIDKAMNQLTDDGVGLFLLPDSILFGSANEFKRFRHDIVESGALKTIISLPTNLFAPVSSLKTSLIIIDKAWRKDQVQFLDASIKKYFSIKRDKSIELNIDRIVNRLNPVEEKENDLIKEAEEQYGLSDFVEIKTSEIVENKYSLKINNYTSSIQTENGKEYSTLGDILKPIYSSRSQGIEVPFIRISELNADVVKTPEGLPFNTTRTAGKLLDQEAILIGTIGGSHKPTLFTGSFIAELSNNVIALQPKRVEAVFMPYMVQELNQKYVIDQMTHLAVGATTLRHLRKDDLLRVKIKLPDIETQKQIYESRSGFVSKDSIDAKKEKLTDEQIFGTIKHEIGNILRGPDGFLDLLPKFLAKNNVNLNKPIVEMDGAESIGQMIEMSQHNIKQVYITLDNMKGVMFSEEKFFKPKRQEIRSYFRKKLQAEKFNSDLTWFIGVDGNFIKPINIFAEFDNVQFDYILRNICLNAINHGNMTSKLILAIDIKSTEESIQIHFINNGEPFPSNFSVEDYVAFGKKTGKSKGSGLGGYVINQIVKNHHGTLELLPGGEILTINDDHKEVKINANIDILITIPKKQ
jgi:type I restriction enzyme M protein